jgi:predicted transcriptional regulator
VYICILLLKFDLTGWKVELQSRSRMHNGAKLNNASGRQQIMKLSEIVKLTQATLVCGEHRLTDEVERAFSSDLMSDVLTIDSENILLITGLANTQAIRTAEMADIHFILMVRNKKASDEMIELARENGMVLMETPYSLFKTSGILYHAGLSPVY